MPYEIFLALRYLRPRRAATATARVTALVAIAGITCGVAALIVALALANGFRDEFRDKILRGTAHLTLLRSDAGPLSEWPGIIARLRRLEGVVDAHATSYDGALLSGPEGAGYTVLRGVDAQAERSIVEIRRTLIAGSVDDLFRPHPLRPELAGAPPDEGDETAPPVEALIGEELAKRTGLARIGAEGWIVTGEKAATPEGFAPRARRLRVAGIFRSGLYDYDATWVYLALESATPAHPTDAPVVRPSVISIEVDDIYATENMAKQVRQEMGERWTIIDWREANRPLFAALELERRTLAIIITLIMLVAALNITATLVLVVVERRAEIAILGAMGARAASIMYIFMIEGACIGAVGALAGVALGLAACFIGDHFALVRLPADVYALSAVPFHARPRDAALAALVAFVISLLATVYPARAAARVRPAEGLRFE